jgi:serine/threonine protein kinase
VHLSDLKGVATSNEINQMLVKWWTCGALDVFSTQCSQVLFLFMEISIIAPVYVSLHDLINEIQNKEIVFTDSKFNFVSPEAKDLISRLLEKNPAKRLACKDAIHHRWF